MIQKQRIVKKRHTLPIVAAIIIALALVVGIGLHVRSDNDAKAANKTVTVVKSEQQATIPNAKDSSPSATSSTSSATTSSSSTNTGNAATDTNPALEVSISRVTADPTFVHTLVGGATSGTCSLTATSPGQATVTASTTVVQDVNDYECQDFGLSSDQFSTGTWTITVSVTSDGSTASSTAFSYDE